MECHHDRDSILESLLDFPEQETRHRLGTDRIGDIDTTFNVQVEQSPVFSGRVGQKKFVAFMKNVGVPF